jgi:predicted branched-subunit amino acid permease
MLIGVLPFGLVCGIVAQGAGLSLAEIGLMSALVYGGSAQLVALAGWGHPAPVLAATAAAFALNLRMALMGPVLAPWLDRLRGWRRWGSLFFMADQNWALSVREMNAGGLDAGFLFGSGVVMWLVWTLSTLAGHAAGALVRPAPGHPLFFAALAVFVSMLVGMWRGPRDLLPWAVAAGVAVALWRAAPGGSWHIVAGALAGSLAGALRDRWRG